MAITTNTANFDGRSRARRILIILAVLALVATLAVVSQPGVFQAVLLVLAVLAILKLLTSNLTLGLAALVPFELKTGTNTDLGPHILLIALISGLLILRGSGHDEAGILPKSSSTTPVLLLCAVAAMAFLIGRLPWFAFAQGAPIRAQLGGLATFLISALTFLLAATQIRTIEWLKRITWIFIGVGAIVTFGRIFSGPLELLNQLVNRNAMGRLFWTGLVAMAVAQGFTNTTLRRGLRIVLLSIAAGVIYLNLLHSGSWASGWIPPLVATITIVLVEIPRIGAAALLAGVTAALSNYRGVTDSLLSGNEYSLLTRFEAWRIVGEIVSASPIVGLGPANYYWYAPLFPVLGYSVRFNSHNNYIDLVAQTGVLGLLAFVWFSLAVARIGWSLLTRVPAGFPRAYALGAIGGLVGTLVAGMLGDWIIPFVYNIGLDGMRDSLIGWLFLGGLVAMEQLYRKRVTELA